MLSFDRASRISFVYLANAARKGEKAFRSLAGDLLQNKVLDDSAGMLYATVVSIVPFFITILPFLRAMGAFESIWSAILDGLSGVIGKENAKYAMDILGSYAMNGGSLGFYGFMIYSVSAVLLVNKIKRLFAKVYRIDTSEDESGILLRLFKYLIYIIAFALFLSFVGFLWSCLFSSAGSTDSGGPTASPMMLRRTLFYAAVATVSFFLLRSMPKVFVSFKSALIGSIFFIAELFFLNLIISLISKIIISRMSLVYGYAAGFLLAFMWLNFFWKTFIAAIDLSYITQYDPDMLKDDMSIRSYQQDSIEIMRMIILGFNSGKGGELLSEISAQLSISSQNVIEICGKFEGANLVHAIGGLKRRLYSPAIPTREINVFHVLKAIEGEGSRSGVGARVTDRLRENEMDSFLGVLVEDL